MNTDTVKTRKAIRLVNTVIDKALTVLFLAVLFIGVYFTYDSWYVYNSASLDRIPGYEWQGTETLKELPKDAKAWLIVDDTKINCPIMQGKTNDDYLNKNPYGEYSLTGSIFMDSLNSPDFTDDYTLLYGHHVLDGYMFGALDYYLDEEYFDSHRTGILTIRDGIEKELSPEENAKAETVEEQLGMDKSYKTRYKVNIFAVVENDANVRVVFDVQDGGDILSYIRENATIYREPENGRILALTTCTDPQGLGRLEVFATLVEEVPVSTNVAFNTMLIE